MSTITSTKMIDKPPLKEMNEKKTPCPK